MGNLWDDPTDPATNDACRGSSIEAASRPQDLVQSDHKYTTMLRKNANDLVNLMYFIEMLTNASFKLADYVPHIEKGVNSEFWEKTVN